MNKTMTSLAVLGIGAAAYSMMRGNNKINGKTMKRMRRQLSRAIY